MQAQVAIRSWAAKLTRSGPYTVADACRDYLADLASRKGEHAAQGARGRLIKHLLPDFGDRLLADLTTADLNAWRNSMVKGSGTTAAIRRSRDTANRVRSSAFAAFNLAFTGGRVHDDLAWRRVKPFKNVGEARKIVLTEAEQQNLVTPPRPICASSSYWWLGPGHGLGAS